MTINDTQNEGSVAGQVQDKAKEMSGQAQEKAKEVSEQVASKARGPVLSQLDQRSTTLGGQVKTNAESMRSAAKHLRSEGNDTPARFAEQAAERVEGVGTWLENSDGDKLVHDVEDFSRRNPWAVAAAALALGFAASRALKASSGRRYSASSAMG